MPRSSAVRAASTLVGSSVPRSWKILSACSSSSRAVARSPAVCRNAARVIMARARSLRAPMRSDLHCDHDIRLGRSGVFQGEAFPLQPARDTLEVRVAHTPALFEYALG